MPRNTFTSGMVQDRVDALAPSSSYSLAFNAVTQTDSSMGFGLVNERSNAQLINIGGDDVGRLYIESIHSTIVFVDDGASTIKIFDHKDRKLTTVVSDSEFGCDWGFSSCDNINAEVKTHGKCDDLMVYFSSGCTYYVVNLSEMMDSARKAAAIECQDCAYFTMFDSICSPSMSAVPVPYAGSTTEGGAVSFATMLEDADGNQTNWFAASNTAYMSTDNDMPGEPATNAVRLILRNLDPRYSRVTIAVIKNSGNVKVVEKLDTIPYSGGDLTFDYYGQKGEVMNPATVVTPTKAYLRGRSLKQHDGRLYFYNLKNEKNLNYQAKANSVNLSWVAYRVPIETQLKYSLPSYMRGESYDFAIIWNYCDGTSSAAFHIPGCGGGVSSSKVSTMAASSFDTFYTDFGAENLDTTDRFLRKREPINMGNESSVLEDAVESDVDAIDTEIAELINAAACTDNMGNPVCCDENGAPVITDVCDAAELAVQNDFEQYSNMVENQLELLAQYGIDTPVDEIVLNQHPTLKEASKYLISKAVKMREYKERTKPTFTLNQGGGVDQAQKVKTYVELDRDDPWARAGGIEGGVVEIASAPTEPSESTIMYPDIKDCEGNRMFPEGNICHHKMPSPSQIPHFISAVNGVVNKNQPGNYEYGDASVIVLGLRAESIQFPTEDELPKPLCPNNPYSIVYVKRNESNKTVLAAGYATGTFQGDVWGRQYAFPRHGVDSFEHVDRSIAAGDGGTSRMGIQTSSTPLANFHSPDTDLMQPFLAATHFRTGLNLKGNGWRHGLDARGRDPIDPFNGKRIDQRGARVSNNLNHYDAAGDEDIPIVGITNAPANSVVTAPNNVSLSLMNRYRESSIFFETSSPIPGNEVDESFVGDVLIKGAPTRCTAPYGYLVRQLDDQYGAVDSRAYIRTGLEGRAGVTSCEGMAGDIFIGPYSKKRTSFVSNKVGDVFNVPAKPGSPCRERTICESPDDKIFEIMGLSANATELPEDGDLYDPKNYCGLHTVGGDCGEFGLSREPGDAAAIGSSESDFYWPSVLNSLVHVFVESEVNTWHRGNGTGDQSGIGDVFYPKLKEMTLDSSAPDEAPWETSYMNQFYVEVEQPSRAQLAKIALIQTIIKLIFPAALLANVSNLEGVFDIVGTMFATSGLSAMWLVAAHTLFTTDRIRNMFGFQQCSTDEEGNDTGRVLGLKDNLKLYNPDYSVKSDLKTYYGITPLYNTCDCDDCDRGSDSGKGRQLNKEIYYTSKQNLDSEIDAYQNVRISQYNELPAHAGHLQNLFIQNGNMYAHTSGGLWAIQLSVGNFPADIGSQLTGEGELLARPMLLLDAGTSEGYAGTRYPNSAINVPSWGYFFVDDASGKVYRFNGKPEEISAYGMKKFFRKHLPFCNSDECFDENRSQRYALGWDAGLERLMLTKHDGAGSFTASYTPIGAEDGRGKWVSLHGYIPDNYFWDRRDLFAIKDNTIYVQNEGKGYLNFFGEDSEHFIQGTMVNPDTLKYFDLETVTIVGEASRAGLENIDDTFTNAAFWTSSKSTGLRPLVKVLDTQETNSQLGFITEDNSVIKVYRRFGEWDISKVLNLLDQGCDRSVITIEGDCQVIPEINNNIVCKAVAAQDYMNRKFGGRYVNFRLVFQGSTDTEIKTYFVDWIENTANYKITP